MTELNIQQKNIINQLKQVYPELKSYSDEQILTIYNQQLDNLQLSEDEKISIMSGNNSSQDFEGLKVEFKPSKEQESQILEKLKSKIEGIDELTTQAEDNNSVVGHVWSWMKNNVPLLDRITDSSKEVRTQSKKELDILNSKDIKTAFEEITGVEFNQENVNKFLDSNNDEIKTKSEQALEEYKIGQNDSADFVSDMLAGMGSMVIYSGAIAAVVAAGAPFALAAGIALGGAALLGAGLKVGLKAADSALGGKKYEFSGKDVLVGGLNGVLAPLTAGFGGRIATSAVTKLGGTVVKEGAELVATNAAANVAKGGFKQFTKEALMNPMGNFYHGKLGTRLIGYGTELGFDGGVSGAVDAAARTAYDGGSMEDIANSALQGGIGGAIGGIALGGIFKYTGNKSHQKGVEIGENIKGRGGNASKIDFSNDDAFLLTKGVTEEQINKLRENEVYEPVAYIFRLYDKYCPESIDRIVKEELNDIDSIKEIKFSQYVYDNFEEIMEISENAFKLLDKNSLADIILDFVKENVDSAAVFEMLKKHPKSFENINIQYYFYSDMIIELSQITDKKLLQQKLDLLEELTKTDDLHAYNKIKTIIEDVDNIDYKHKILTELKDKPAFRGKLKILLEKNPETIDFILKNYNESMKDTWDDSVLDKLLKISDNELNKAKDIYAMSKRLKEEIGVEEKVPDWVLTQLKQLINNDYQMAYIKDLYEMNGKDFSKIQDDLVSTIEYVVDDIKKELLILDTQHGLGLANSKNTIKKVTEKYQIETAKKLLDLGIKPYTIEKMLFLNSTKEIDDFINKKIKLNDFKFLESLSYISPENLEIMIKCSGTPLEEISKLIPIREKDLLDRIIKNLDNWTVNNIDIDELKSILIMSIRTDEDIDFASSLLDSGKTFKDLQDFLTILNSTWAHEPKEKTIHNILNLKLLEKDLDPVSIINLAKYENIDVIDSILNLFNKSKVESIRYVTDYISKDLDIAKAQLEFLDDILQVDPDYFIYLYREHSLVDTEMSLEDVLARKEWFGKLIKDGNFTTPEVEKLVKEINSENAKYVDLIINNPRLKANNNPVEMKELIRGINDSNAYLIDLLLKDETISILDIGYILQATSEVNIKLAEKLCTTKDFDKTKLSSILHYTKEHNLALAEKLCTTKDFPVADISCILGAVNDFNIKFAEELCFDKSFPKKHIASILSNTTPENYDFTRRLCYDPDFPKQHIYNIIGNFREDKFYFLEKLCFDKNLDFPKEHVGIIITYINDTNKDLARKLCYDKDFPKEHIADILSRVYYDDQLEFVNELCFDKELKFDKSLISSLLQFINYSNKDFIKALCFDKEFTGWNVIAIARRINLNNIEMVKRLCFDKESSLPKTHIAIVLDKLKDSNKELAELLCFNKELRFQPEEIADILSKTNASNMELAKRLCFDDDLKLSSKCIANLLNCNCPDLISKRLDNPQFVKDIIDFQGSNSFIPSIFIEAYDFIGKKSISELSKVEKRKFIEMLLANKSELTGYNGFGLICAEKIPLLPTSSSEYALIMKKIANSLNISMEPVSPEQVLKFNQVIDVFSKYLKSADLSSLEEINLTMPHSEFISNVQDIIKHLPIEEQAKVQDFYGFKIIDGKLSGYPNLTAKDFNLAEISDEQTIAVVNKLQKLVSDYVNNNFVIVKDNPLLNQQLKELSQILPEIFNQIDGSKTSIEMLKSLQKIVKTQAYESLSESDKRVIMVATLLHNTDKISNNVAESSFDAYFIAKKFNMSDEEAKKVYSIIEASDFVEMFMDTQKRRTVVNKRGSIIGQEREDKFDLMAFKLKEGNLLELAQMLYTSKYEDGFTRHFDKLLSDRIQQIKSSDFILPQTSIDTYRAHAKKQTIQRGIEEFEIDVVKSEDIEDFYAYIHTPEAGYATGGSRGANFANFDAFAVLNDDKVICTSYITNGMAGLAREFKNGFIFDVQNDKQYVAYDTDIFSLAKNIPDMIVEYFRDRGFQANRGRGEKFGHRTMVSNVLKSILYGKDYYTMIKNIDSQITVIRRHYQDKIADINQARREYIRNKFGTENTTAEQTLSLKKDARYIEFEAEIKSLEKQQADEILNIQGYSDIKEMDELYAKRLDEIKLKLGDKTMTLDNLAEIDPEFAEAYRKFLRRNGSEHTGEASLLRSNWHNEALVSNPKITAIFTIDLDDIPVEYLRKAKQENIPIVVIKI